MLTDTLHYVTIELPKFNKQLDELDGIAEGEAIGEARGRAEGRADTARAMKARGMDAALIADITGLTQEQIAEL